MTDEAYEGIQYPDGYWDSNTYDWPYAYATEPPVVATGEMSEDEAQAYASRALELFPACKGVYAIVDGDEVELHYELSATGFERIRRITGYLVGTLDRFNDGKRAEEAERVKHGLPGCCS